ncbi:glycosyltransferase [Acetobacteraceae bacterium]|nr:glycosyltransferase [Acetobacteraceae bacterium]
MRWLSYSTLGIWGFLVAFWGRYWQGGPFLSSQENLQTQKYPEVLIIVPARNEEEHIAVSLKSLLNQDYQGTYRVVVVDDESTDTTRAQAFEIAKDYPALTVIEGKARPSGWSGKLWALHQGINARGHEIPENGFVLFTDADILHAPDHLDSLVKKALHERLDLVSEMVMLQCNNVLEKTFIPAFVYFFAFLYPFRKISNPDSIISGAAGGTVLLKKEILDRIGGVASIRGALIDDCTLAARVKRMGGHLYLGCSQQAWSLRSYDNIKEIWNMIARTAYVQLRYSPILLLLVLFGMLFIWFGPLVAAIKGKKSSRFAGISAYLIACATFIPTLKWFRLPLWRALPLPFIAFFYSLATLGSAYNHYFGKGVEWHQRTYDENHPS